MYVKPTSVPASSFTWYLVDTLTQQHQQQH